MNKIGDHGPQGMIIPRSGWTGTMEPDGLLYSLESTRAKRLALDKPHIGPDVGAPVLDDEGHFTFVTIDGADIAEQLPPTTDADGNAVTGTYVEMSQKATHLNIEQERRFGARAYTFYPAPIPMLKTA